MNPVVVRNLRIGEGIPKICVPIVGRTKEEILQAAEEICRVPADFAEWRADWFASVFEIEEVKCVLANLRKVLGEMPILFTFRTKQEGGEQEIDVKQYLALNRAVIETGDVDLVDVEVFTVEATVKELLEKAHQYHVKVVGSNHDFAKTPAKEEILLRLRYMQEVGVDIPKIAVMPQSRKDVITLLNATQKMVTEYADRPIITMSMAGLGAVSRVSGEVFGSAVTFGTAGAASAPGQMHAKELKMMLEMLHCAK